MNKKLIREFFIRNKQGSRNFFKVIMISGIKKFVDKRILLKYQKDKI